ncbi:MAG: hypothetical protein IT299_11870 [Dehalococcoidia bacterium]|nr:hypothetical protein [Dehalococcoidia bacterium]
MTREVTAPNASGGATRIPRWLVPAGLLVVSVLSVGAVFWGYFVADPQIKVFEYDAGPVEGLTIGGVRPIADLDFYLVGLASGKVRAVDGRPRSSDCAVRYLPDDPRGRAVNANGVAGVFEDPCSGAVYALHGDQIDPGTGPVEPLRTFEIAYKTLSDGKQHIFVEVLGRDRPPAPAP